RERRLVACAALERRSVRDREERQAEADDEEGGRRRRPHRRAREGEQREAHGIRRSARGALAEAHQRPEEPYRGDGGDEADERRQQQKKRPVAAGGQRVRAQAATREADNCRGRGTERSDIEDANAPPGDLVLAGPRPRENHERRSEPRAQDDRRAYPGGERVQ